MSSDRTLDDLKDAGVTAARFARGKFRELRPNLLDARDSVRQTNETLAAAEAGLALRREEAQESLVELGAAELEAYDGSLREFADLFSRLKNVELTDLLLEDAPPVPAELSSDPFDIDFGAIEAARAALLSGGAGAAIGMTTFAAVGQFAAASTGAAISGLSGAAATNATLAWLGGGSIAAGGGGVAVGTAVLGGLVGLPVLGVGGLVVRRAGRKALAEAEAHAAEAEIAVAELETAATRVELIGQRARRMLRLVHRLDRSLVHSNGALGYLVARSDDYASWDTAARSEAMLAASVARTLRTVVDVPVIDDDGSVTDLSKQVADDAERFVLDHQQELS